MYYLIAFQTGILLALLIFFNGMIANTIGVYNSNLIFQLIGFILIDIYLLVKRPGKFEIFRIPIMFFLPGFLSVISVVLNNVCISKIGITLTIAICVFGQLVISNFIDHFGLFEMPIRKFRKEKFIGFIFILLGIIAMIIL